MVELSVVIPTFNRVESVRRCLVALDGQTQSTADFEVIVVVDGSTDGTCEMLDRLSTAYRLVVEYQPNQGAALARNRGAQRASGKYCLFLDDDIVPSPALIAEHLAGQRRGPHGDAVVTLGHLDCQVRRAADGLARQYAEWWSDHFAQLAHGRQPNNMDCWSGNMSVPLEAFRSVGGFDPEAGQSHDIELGYRLEQYGLDFVYLPNAV
ncbi:MAG TPA: glycosyltransferase family A protein, partial [Chloroflexota bacterium]|nr:glycosyltransferase family A protein [Chloroflexota bacterium]